MRNRPRADAGLTVVELMVVLSVLAVIVSIAIPIMRTAKKSGNETATIANLRTVGCAQATYHARTGSYGTLAQLTAADFVDTTFSAPSERSGYGYNDQVPTQATWSLNADPLDPGVTGDRFFYMDETGVIRSSGAAAATGTDPAI